ncbi:MAG: hypothetical protein HQ523_01640 [Lentisphaerae bacterium]|nr:hypothetical protein [Lentisphaerota bacterium]
MKSNSKTPAILLLICVLLVSFWQIMAWRARRGFDAFRITAATLDEFTPQIKGYTLTEMLVPPDPLQPNIISYRALPNAKDGFPLQGGQPVLIRLAHGYNMVDCMRIKHFTVMRLTPTSQEPVTSNGAFPREAWKLTSSIEDQSIWMTSMLGSETFGLLDISTESMPFPKIGTPDDPGWKPSGLRLRSLRQPLHNFKRLMHAKWNNARCDPLTFLGLRRPVYASDEILTLVSTVAVPPPNDANPTEIEAELIRMEDEVHTGMIRELMTYRAK